MCLMIRILYKFNTVRAFERAVNKVICWYPDKFIRGKVIYHKRTHELNWENLTQELEKAITENPRKIHGVIAVENQ